MRTQTWVGLLSVSILGCVGGDNTSDASAQGALGGACFANGTCNTGLVCTPQGNMLVCEPPDATVDAPVDQTASDAGSDASDAAPCTVQPKLGCGIDCPATGCCPKDGKCQSAAADAATCTGMDLWACQQNADCTFDGGPGFCCTYLNGVDLTACPPSYMVMGPPFCSASKCTAGYQLCTTDVECVSSGKTCHVAMLDQATVGICM